MNLYVVAFDHGRMVVHSVSVTKETAVYYFIGRCAEDRYAFGYSARVEKHRFATTPQGAIEKYLSRRESDRFNARAVVQQATEQIAEAEAMLASFAVAVAR